MVVHNLVDHDLVVKIEAVRPAGRGLVGIQPGANTVGRPAASRLVHFGRIEDPVAVGSVQKQPLAG